MGWLTTVLAFLTGLATWYYGHEQILMSWSKVLWFISQVITFTRRAAVKGRLEADLVSAAKIVNEDIEGAIPASSKVKWVKPEQVEAILKDGKAIICLSYDNNERKKEVAAIYALIKAALLNRSRSYIEPAILDSIHLTVTNTVLARKDRKAQDLFIEEILNPLVLSDTNLLGLCESLEELEDRGLLRQVLIREFDKMPDMVGGSPPKFPHRKESAAFVSFLCNLAGWGRHSGASTQGKSPTDYVGSWIKVGIVFVAEKDKFIQQGTGPYVKAVDVDFDRGCRDVYLLALSRDNIHVVNCVASAIKMNCHQWSIMSRKTFFSALGMPGICVLVQKSAVEQDVTRDAGKIRATGNK